MLLRIHVLYSLPTSFVRIIMVRTPLDPWRSSLALVKFRKGMNNVSRGCDMSEIMLKAALR